MLFDARTLPENVIIETDVCVVGAGAAGITLAREFIGQPFRVCLLESGGLDFDHDTQSLYLGENIGLHYSLLGSRLRYFGGSTNHWSGACRPLDDLDFEPREWIPHSGWPFSKSHLVPFYKRAQSICQLGPFTYDAEDWETQSTSRFPFLGDRMITKIFQHSPPTRFGKVYRDEIAGADNISTYLFANVVEIETSDNARTVTRLHVATLLGNKFWLAAKKFILAMGGIENPRLLLLSNKIQSSGLGNQNDLVGRFFMEHQEFLEPGFFLPSNPDLKGELYQSHIVKQGSSQVNIRAVFSLSPEIMRLEQLVNFVTDCIFVVELEPVSKSKGVTSLKHMLKAIRRGDIPDDFVEHLGNVITDMDDIAALSYKKFFGRPIGFFKLITASEQVPNPESRITLSTERDRLNKNRVRLDWRLSPIDRHSIRRAHEIMGQEFGRAGLGRAMINLDDDDNVWPFGWQNHHMGTTRMHVDPKKGVVDEHCRVHNISNLFITGSSVFPTSGSSTPTITIVALAVRLADHIKGLTT